MVFPNRTFNVSYFSEKRSVCFKCLGVLECQHVSILLNLRRSVAVLGEGGGINQ